MRVCWVSTVILGERRDVKDVKCVLSVQTLLKRVQTVTDLMDSRDSVVLQLLPLPWLVCPAPKDDIIISWIESQDPYCNQRRLCHQIFFRNTWTPSSVDCFHGSPIQRKSIVSIISLISHTWNHIIFLVMSRKWVICRIHRHYFIQHGIVERKY